MDNNLATPLEKVEYNRLNNIVKNAKNAVASSFLSFAFALREMNSSGKYATVYETFIEYCAKELDMPKSTVYDYLKIADFVIDNVTLLDIEKASILGHKKLKLLTQKLPQMERKHRAAILKNIDIHDSFPKIESKIKIIENKKG